MNEKLKKKTVAIPSLTSLNHLISILIGLPLGGEWIPLLMVEVLLQIEEGVEEDRRHLALLQVLQRDGVLVQRPDHVQHLRGEDEEVWLKKN